MPIDPGAAVKILFPRFRSLLEAVLAAKKFLQPLKDKSSNIPIFLCNYILANQLFNYVKTSVGDLHGFWGGSHIADPDLNPLKIMADL